MRRYAFFICFFLTQLQAIEVSTITHTPSEYVSKNNLASHLVAAGKEAYAFIKKMTVRVRDNVERTPQKNAVLLVHGLNSSPNDWHMLINDLKGHTFEVYTLNLSYWKKDGFNQSVQKIQNKARAILQIHPNVDIIGHSLGGLAAVEAVNQLNEQKKQVKRVITINAPLQGTTVLNRFFRLFLPKHLIDVLTYKGDFTKRLSQEAQKTQQAGVRFFHTATESDHLVRTIDACFLPHFEEGIVLTEVGHLSTLNSQQVRDKVIEWLKR